MRVNSQKIKRIIFPTLLVAALASGAISTSTPAKADAYYGYGAPGFPTFPSSNPAPQTGNTAIAGGDSYRFYNPRLTLNTLSYAMNCPGTSAGQRSAAMDIFNYISNKKQRTHYIYGNDGAFVTPGNGGPLATPTWQWISGANGQNIEGADLLQVVQHNTPMFDYASTVSNINPDPITDPGGPFLVKNIIEALAGTTLSTIWYGGGPAPDYYIEPTGAPTDFQYIPGPSPDAPLPADITTACQIVSNALAGDVSALASIQQTFVSNDFFSTLGYTPCDMYQGLNYNLFQNGASCPGMTTTENVCLPTGENVGKEALAFMIGGEGLNALNTIRMAMPVNDTGTPCQSPGNPSGCNPDYGLPMGDPDAIAVLDVIFTYPPVNNVPDLAHNCVTIESGCDTDDPTTNINESSKFAPFLAALSGALQAADYQGAPPDPQAYLDCAIDPNNCNGRDPTIVQMFTRMSIEQYLSITPIQPNPLAANFHQYNDEPADPKQYCPRRERPTWHDTDQHQTGWHIDNDLSVYTYIGEPAIIYLQQSYSVFPPVSPPPVPPIVTTPGPSTVATPNLSPSGSWGGSLSLGSLFNTNTGSQVNEGDPGYENPCDGSDKKEVDIGDRSHSWPFDIPSGTAATGFVHADATTPCRFTRATRNLQFAMSYLGGEQWRIYFKNWIDEQWMGGSGGEPVLKKMAKQLTMSLINQTRQLGSAIDAKVLSESAMNLQKDETTAKKKASPSQLTCTSASMLGTFSTQPPAATPPTEAGTWTAGNTDVTPAATPAQPTVSTATSVMSQSATANALSLALQKDLQRQAQGATGAGATGGPLADQQEKWKKYCTLFSDPMTNNGNSGCQTPGLYKNADIDVEKFLFKDTIDMTLPDEKEIVPVLLRNLAQPVMEERIPDSVLSTPEAEQVILRRKHIRAARNIANNTLTGIVSRRQAGPDLPPPPPPAPPPPPPGQMGAMPSDPDDPTAPTFSGDAASGSYLDFLTQLGGMESGNSYTAENGSPKPSYADGTQLNYIGRWQMGEPALVTVGCVARDSDVYSQSYKNAPGEGGQVYKNGHVGMCKGLEPNGHLTDNSSLANGLQDELIRKLMQGNWRTIHRLGLDQYICNTVNGILVTPSGLLAGAHLVGAGGLQTFLTGKGGHKVYDGNGVHVSKYMTTKNGYVFAGHQTPFSTVTNCGAAQTAFTNENSIGTNVGAAPGVTAVVTPPEPVDIATAVKDIRKKAGIEPSRIAEKPSYNEVMQAMTKERFFDPEYYIKTADNIGAVKQEQASVQAYISIQMQDIYKLQEQINMLLAARAGLKYNTQPRPNGIQQAPLQ